MALDFGQIERAREILRNFLPETNLTPAKSLPNAYLKNEGELPTGSFKTRGALVALYRNLERGPVRGVVASSTGNFGAAVAYAANMLKVPAIIFLPRDPNPVKRRTIANLGAEIIEGGVDISEATGSARACAEQRNLFFLLDASDPDVPAGAATIACEILEQKPDIAAIYVPMGDTALIRGVAFAAKHLRPGIRIIGVQAERAPSYGLSWRQGEVVSTESCDTIADGLATREPLADNVRAIRELVDEVRLVSETELLDAVRRLHFDEHVTAEPSGAATTAAFLRGAYSNAALLITGANLTPALAKRAGIQ